MMKVKEKLSKIELDKALVAIVKDVTAKERLRREAFNQLYENHQRQVFFYLLKNVKDSETAEDLMMVTFEKAHEKIHMYEDTFAFSTWLYKIALNCLIDHKRKATFEVLSIESLKSFIGSEGDIFEFQIASNSLNPEEIVIRDNKISMVQKAIEAIDNELIKSLMTERFINDLSFEQIAEKIGVDNNSTIRVNIARGKEIIKRFLQGK